MARVTVAYSGTSLQTSTLITQEIEHESVDGKQLDIQKLSSRDGGKLLGVSFSPRVIKLRGYIKSTTQALLETAIDDFKELLNGTTKNLDISYAGGTRRYVCDMAGISLIRKYFNVTFAEWEATFVCAKTPFGRTTDTTSSEYTINSIGTYAGSYVALGNYRPKPRIVIRFIQCAVVTVVKVNNTTSGDWIKVTKPTEFSAGDVVIIDCDQYTCTINGVATDYDGFFPLFNPKGNDLRISFGKGIKYKATVQIIYYPTYL